ncbi:hypothetical protein AB5I41_31750 [Sphingomonas sp. MMS24-JH45]
MRGLSTQEQAAVAHLDAAAMLARTECWCAINSGTRNIAGVAAMAGELADAFAALPGEIALVEPAAAESVAPDGRVSGINHGRHLRLTVRPGARVQLLLTGIWTPSIPSIIPSSRRAGSTATRSTRPVRRT